MRRRAAPGRKQYEMHKEEARTLIAERIEYYNQFYQFSYNRVAIRNQRRCWGSCSALKNLNFSYKLLFLPSCICDYIVVHELCHLRELNHSAAFWAAVAEVMPDYQSRATALRAFERRHGTSLTALMTWQRSHEECEKCLR